ncbi:uncharacterized protein FFFS_15955 [Fusarium fujikuroi]|nr:uncharacterized protein FFFS_15955 [Fusarium fujikuroi]
MTTPRNEPTTGICQCTKAKEACESEGDPGTTVICPSCHLEEATAGECDEQAAFLDDKKVYAAFKDSPSLMRIAARPEEQSIKLVIRKRQKGQQAFAKNARKLVNEYGTTPIVTSLKIMLDEGVFTSTAVAKRRFPDLFPEEQVPKYEEGQESATGHPSTNDVELLDEFFQNSKTFETEGNAESLPNLLSSVSKIQNIILLRLNLNFEQVNQFLLNAEEFIRLLDTPLYLDAVKQLRQRIEEVLLMANRDAALVHDEADGKVAEIEAQREGLNREEEGVKRHRDENLDNIRVSIERDIFAAMGQAKDTLPGIGLADSR